MLVDKQNNQKIIIDNRQFVIWRSWVRIPVAATTFFPTILRFFMFLSVTDRMDDADVREMIHFRSSFSTDSILVF